MSVKGAHGTTPPFSSPTFRIPGFLSVPDTGVYPNLSWHSLLCLLTEALTHQESPLKGTSHTLQYNLLFQILPLHWCVCAKSLQSCPTLCDPMDCSPPGSSVHGILRSRILEWVAMPSRGSNLHLLHLLHWQAGSLPLAPSGKFSSVQFSSVTQSCPTLCDPVNRSTPGLPVHHQLPEFTQTHVRRVGDTIQPSHPLSSPSLPTPIPPSISLFQWVNSSHEVAKVLEFQL